LFILFFMAEEGEFMLRKMLLISSVLLALYSVTPAQTRSETARKFDEFGDIQASDLIARLDNLAIAVNQEPASKAFLIVYRTRRDLQGLSNRYAHRMRSYLMGSRGLPSERIITVDGGVASCLWQELWIVMPGTTPKPRADVYDNSYRPSIYKFDEHYYHAEKPNPDMLSYWAEAPEDLISYLEAFGETLLKDRKLVGYLVAFREADGDNRRVTQRMLRTERNFLIKEFRIEPSRIKTIDGGYRQSRTMELWLAQPGYRPIVTSYRIAGSR
jgi:hypothetical protein